MSRTAIVSIDGHVAASAEGYRPYVESEFLGPFDEWLKSQEGQPPQGNVQPGLDPAVQWDSALRQEAIEREGVIAEVLFPNTMPFSKRRFEDASFGKDPRINRQAALAYNRWLADFCSELPGRRSGMAVVSFDDIDQAVADIELARNQGLGGIMMPALEPGGRFFFDPALDPVWAACQDQGMVISQHGGAGAPEYQPAGFAAIMTLAIEQSFFSGRCLWQMILGGVFERFPALQLVFVETGANWIPPAIAQLDWRMKTADDWVAFAVFMQRKPQFSRLASEYWATNCHAGVSPFAPTQFDYDGLRNNHGLRNSDGASNNHGASDSDGASDSRRAPSNADTDTFRISADKAMFGVDYPHFESIAPNTARVVGDVVAHPGVPTKSIRKLLCENAAKVYGFDLNSLQPEIDRIGFDLSNLGAGNAA